MRIKDRGIIYRGEENTDHQSCAFPGISVFPSGRWFSCWRGAPTKDAMVDQHPLFSWSDDEGRTWSEPTNPFPWQVTLDGRPGYIRKAEVTPLNEDRQIALLCWCDASDPSLPFFNETTEGILDLRLMLSFSEDNGETWSEPSPMDTSPFDMPVPMTGPILAISDEELICQIELNKHYYDTSVWQHKSVMLFSRDGGKTWPEHSIVTADPENRMFYWDQRPAIIGGDEILDLFWTFDRKDAVYLNIHARHSSDRGRNWSELWDTGVPGQPAPAVQLEDRRLAMVYVDRTADPKIKCRVSDDSGHSWPQETELLIYETELTSQTWNKKEMKDAWAEMGKFSVGLPHTASLGGNEFLVIYYAGPKTDLTDIHWARLGE